MINYEVALQEFEIFILVMMRMSTFIYAAPFFNTANTPRRTKVAFAFFLTVIVYYLKLDMQIEYNGIIEYITIIIKEMAVGLLLGQITSFCTQIIMFSGKIIDMDVGLSMAQIYDPTTRMQSGIFGNFYYYILMLLLMVSGMQNYLVSAIVETYKVIPVGKVQFSTSIYTDVLKFMSDYIVIGFRIALPVFAATLILNCILAILAKVAPQMNMLAVGFQIKIIVGILVVSFTIVMMPAVSTYIENAMKTYMSSLVRGMSP